MRNTVLFLIDSLELLGGAEKNLLAVASGLNKDKYRVIVACLQKPLLRKEFEGRAISFIDLKIKRIYSPVALVKAFRMARFLRKEKVKIVVTYLESSDVWGSIVARIAGVPVLVSSRRDMGFNLKRRHIIAYRLVNRLFDRIIAVSEKVKEGIIKKEGGHPEKIAVIYNGVDIYNENKMDKAALRRSLGLDPDKYTVTMVANLSPIKGHKDLLYAASEVIENYRAVQFLLVGSDKNGYGKELRDLARELGIEKNVTFAGFRKNIPEILKVSDISVSSSTTEGFSNAILEYMAAGKPVVATDVGGNRELVVDGETGFLVPVRNPSVLAGAMLKIIKDSGLKEKLGENGRRRVREFFSREVMVNNIDKLFNNIINAKLSTEEAIC